MSQVRADIKSWYTLLYSSDSEGLGSDLDGLKHSLNILGSLKSSSVGLCVEIVDLESIPGQGLMTPRRLSDPRLTSFGHWQDR